MEDLEKSAREAAIRSLTELIFRQDEFQALSDDELQAVVYARSQLINKRMEMKYNEV